MTSPRSVVTQTEPKATVTSPGPLTVSMTSTQFLEPEYALMLLAGGSGGVGYLLKDRVADAAELLAAAERVATGGSAIDPSVVDEIVRGRSTQERRSVLTSRERQVMGWWRRGGRIGPWPSTCRSQ